MSLVQDAFEKHAQKMAKTFGPSRMKTVGASEAGQCIRKIGYLKHDNPEFSNRTKDHKDGWGAARRGNTFEDNFFVPAMKALFGEKILYTGKDQKTWQYGLLSATPDGILIDQPRDVLAGLMVHDIGPSRCIVLDCKTIDPRINLAEPKIEHFIQVQVQMGVLRETSSYKPDYAVIVYVNASFYDDVVEFVVKFDPKVFYQAQVRAKKILDAEHAYELKPEGWIAGGNECQYCAFAVACKELRGVGNEPPKKLKPQVAAMLADLARQEKEWDAKASEATEEKRNIQEEIKTILRENGLRKYSDGSISVNWSNVAGRPAFDMPKLKAAAAEAGFDLQQFERVGAPSDRMVINILKRDRLASKPKGVRMEGT